MTTCRKSMNIYYRHLCNGHVQSLYSFFKVFRGKKATGFQSCDNESVVYILNSRTSTAPDVKHLRCSLLMTAAKHNFIFTAGSSNKIPDALSHFNWQAFHRLALHADHHPRVILPHLWEELTYQAWSRTALP